MPDAGEKSGDFNLEPWPTSPEDAGSENLNQYFKGFAFINFFSSLGEHWAVEG